MIAGVHSTVWIFAISAELISRALSYSSLVGHLRVLGVQAVADRVVLAREQRVQQREPDPPVVGDAREVDVLLQVAGGRPSVVDPQLAALVGAQRGGEAGSLP